jgi:HAD superfamily hydrolase (TIGR01509 family)
MRFADLDAVTVDAFGTLLSLVDPVPRLEAALRERGVERASAEVATAFGVEAGYYRAHSHEARDAATLTELRLACTEVFLDAVSAHLEAEAFCPAYIESLTFEPVPGAVPALDRLAARGLSLAVIANWDPSVRHQLQRHGLEQRFRSVVVSAEVGAPKPDPRPFYVALSELGVTAGRAIHVGDDESDQKGAAAAGMRFLWAPLADAFAGWG